MPINIINRLNRTNKPTIKPRGHNCATWQDGKTQESLTKRCRNQTGSHLKNLIVKNKIKNEYIFLIEFYQGISYCCFLWIIQYLSVLKNSGIKYSPDGLTIELLLMQWIKIWKILICKDFLFIYLSAGLDMV